MRNFAKVFSSSLFFLDDDAQLYSIVLMSCNCVLLSPLHLLPQNRVVEFRVEDLME